MSKFLEKTQIFPELATVLHRCGEGNFAIEKSTKRIDGKMMVGVCAWMGEGRFQTGIRVWAETIPRAIELLERELEATNS